MQLKLNKILVPIDFSDVSINAFHYAVKLAKKVNAGIEMLHVVETYEMNVALLEEYEIDELIEKKSMEKMQQMIDEIDVATLKITKKTKKGKIKRTIVNATIEDDIDLVIIGTTGVSGKSPFSKHILGSNAHRVIQAAECPVLTVPSGDYDPVYENIVLPLDIEKETTMKIDSAIRWAKVFNSTVHLLSVFNFFEEYRVDIEDLKRQLKSQAEKIHSHGVKVKVKSIRYADVAHAVLDYAEDNHADLIIIMTRQETKIDQIFLGSRARDVITKSVVPVLSLRPRKA